MNNRVFFLAGVFVAIFIIYKLASYEAGETAVEQQPITIKHILEAVVLAKVAMRKVDDYFLDFRNLPISNKDAGLSHASEISSKNVKSVNFQYGQIVVQFKKHLQQGVKFNIKPEFSNGIPVKLEWRCNIGGLSEDLFLEAFPECMYTNSDLKDDFLKGIRTSNLELMQEVIDDGIDVNERLFYQTPLFFTIEKRKVEFVAILLNNGADIELPSNKKNGKTPLMYALTNGSSEVVRYLVEHGADVNAKDNNGKTVLKFIRFGDNDMKNYLIDAGAIIEDY